MSVIISFRLDQNQADQLDHMARAENTNRGAYLRVLVGSLITPQPALNVMRHNQVSEYSQAALAALVDHFLPDQQPQIITTTAQRLEQFHGQK